MQILLRNMPQRNTAYIAGCLLVLSLISIHRFLTVADKFHGSQGHAFSELLQTIEGVDSDTRIDHLQTKSPFLPMQQTENSFQRLPVSVRAGVEGENTQKASNSALTIGDPIYVVLMTEDKSRQKHVDNIKIKFNTLNISIWTAVMPRDILTGKFSSYYNQKTISNVREGAIACALSHLTLLQWFVTTSMESIIVLEDDAELDDNFVKMYNMLNNA